MLVAKLKVLGKRYLDADVDVVRFCADRTYAADVLVELARCTEPELVAAAVEAMARLGMVGVADRSKEAPRGRYER